MVRAVDCGLDLEEVFRISDVFFYSMRHHIKGFELFWKHPRVRGDHRVGSIGDVVCHTPVIGINNDLYRVSHVIDRADLLSVRESV